MLCRHFLPNYRQIFNSQSEKSSRPRVKTFLMITFFFDLMLLDQFLKNHDTIWYNCIYSYQKLFLGLQSWLIPRGQKNLYKVYLCIFCRITDRFLNKQVLKKFQNVSFLILILNFLLKCFFLFDAIGSILVKRYSMDCRADW